MTALKALDRVRKPSTATVRKLAELYPSSKHVPVKRLGEAFDPLQDCVATSAKKAKKAARIKPVFVEFVVLPKSTSRVLPRGKQRQELARNGQVKTLQIKRTMSPLQVRNTIVAGFSHVGLTSWEFLDVSGGRLESSTNQRPGGEICQRRGAVYLVEKVGLWFYFILCC